MHVYCCMLTTASHVIIVQCMDVITTDSWLFQIQMSAHNSLLCGGEPYDNLFLIPVSHKHALQTLSWMLVSVHTQLLQTSIVVV